MTTTEASLLQIPATSGGRDLPTAKTTPVINPSTGTPFAAAPSVTPEQLEGVFEVARDAFDEWRRDDDRRRDAMRACAEALRAHVDELAPILTAEQGRPLAGAEGEIRGSAKWLDYYADLEVPREIIRDDEQGYEEVFRRPLGVVSAITPWNFPVGLAFWKIAPALRAGNTLVVKPSAYTPMTTLAIGRILRDILPAGVLNVVSGKLGSEMVTSPIPRKVSFTGSTEVGKLVAANAAPDLKRLTLELGGNDPAVILEDVDVDTIADKLFWNAFTNNGQLCFAVKRIYAHESIKSDLVDALATIARSVNVDDGFIEGAQLGPINNKPQLDSVVELVADARSNGARIAAGGERIDRPGYFHQPTIVDSIDDGVRLVDEEQFGPVLPILSFRDEQDAIARANRSQYGLTASVWSGDPERAYALAGRIESGQVAVNHHGAGVRPHLPFGGHKWSGIGVENGPWGLYGFTELQVIAGPPRVA